MGIPTGAPCAAASSAGSAEAAANSTRTPDPAATSAGGGRLSETLPLGATTTRPSGSDRSTAVARASAALATGSTASAGAICSV
jgi:hypothetical protein